MALTIQHFISLQLTEGRTDCIIGVEVRTVSSMFNDI